MPAQLPASKYEEMYRAYCVEQSVAYVARKCGVAYTTAQRYVRVGDTDRDLEPIADRWRAVIRKTQAMTDAELARSYDEVARVFIAKLELIDQLHLEAMENMRGKMEGRRLPRLLDMTTAVESSLRMRKWLFELGKLSAAQKAEDMSIADMLLRFQELTDALTAEQLKIVQEGIATLRETGELPKHVYAILSGGEDAAQGAH